MVNAWIQHVKKWAQENNKTYSCALTEPDCKKSYIKPANDTRTPEQKKRDSRKYWAEKYKKMKGEK